MVRGASVSVRDVLRAMEPAARVFVKVFDPYKVPVIAVCAVR